MYINNLLETPLYKHIILLGSGGYANVLKYTGKYKICNNNIKYNNKDIVIKLFDDHEYYIYEKKIHDLIKKKINKKYLDKYFNIYIDNCKINKNISMDYNNEYVLILNDTGFSLYDYYLLHNNKLFFIDYIKIIKSILDAIKILYKNGNGFIHNDIKLENIMINKNNEIKIIDYGIIYDIKNNDPQYNYDNQYYKYLYGSHFNKGEVVSYKSIKLAIFPLFIYYNKNINDYIIAIIIDHFNKNKTKTNINFNKLKYNYNEKKNFYNSKNLLNEEVFSIMLLLFDLYEIVIDKQKDKNTLLLNYLNNNDEYFLKYYSNVFDFDNLNNYNFDNLYNDIELLSKTPE